MAAHKDACLRSGHSHEVLVCAPQKSLESTCRNLSFTPEESPEQVLRLLFCCCDEQYHQKLPGDKRLSYISQLKVCCECSQGRNPSRSHGEKLLTGLLPADCSVCIFIQLRTTFPRVAMPTVSWALPHASLKGCPRRPYKPVRWKHFLN